ncbi:hypothetical protein DSOL_4106 [Desulfosporosinus metallidurans]|uniref:Uncharacterized protein n=1 Tax=Desulfosporosinus metallidurans TaxID=1888891 RepID=A0A1Q8QLX8_9FIRM|nr:hypothetical protein DSOL_4106 [Desulfosporosinus metallidurans]
MRQRVRMGIMGTAKGPHIQALATALQNRGAEVSFVSPQRLTSFIPEPATIITGAGGSRENLRDLDALLVRSLPGGSLEQVIYRVDVLHRLEKLGLKVINRAAVLEKNSRQVLYVCFVGRCGLASTQNGRDRKLRSGDGSCEEDGGSGCETSFWLPRNRHGLGRGSRGGLPRFPSPGIGPVCVLFTRISTA